MDQSAILLSRHGCLMCMNCKVITGLMCCCRKFWMHFYILKHIQLLQNQIWYIECWLCSILSLKLLIMIICICIFFTFMERVAMKAHVFEKQVLW